MVVAPLPVRASSDNSHHAIIKGCMRERIRKRGDKALDTMEDTLEQRQTAGAQGGRR